MRPPNTFANDAQHIPWDKLPAHGDQRMVDGRLMTRDEYDACDYRRDGEGYWMASLAGLHAWARLVNQRREERRSSWQARRDAEDAYSEEITTMLEDAGA